jgi:hypothetical protein
MGTCQDMAQRESHKRVDDLDRRHRVASAREAIYEKRYAVNSAGVERLLFADSLVPTIVGIFLSYLIHIMLNILSN